ncbi:MAG: hypothetical protein B6229_02145 [Spirochaetaceae bacterium 4572_7]|nr:MAG: hypothetical protein B6229_02145 [Spirochaetaceae bacterium 4572_7]
MFNTVFEFNKKDVEPLFNKYLSLNNTRKEIVNIYAASYHAVSNRDIHAIIFNKNKKFVSGIDKEILYLEKLGLLTKLGTGCAIARLPRETILDYLAAQPEFELISKTVFNFFNNNYYEYTSAIRNFRLALHGDDLDDISYWYNRAIDRMHFNDIPFAITIFNSPFSEQRLKLLPGDLQYDVLEYIFNYQQLHGLEDSDILKFFTKNYNSFKNLIDTFDLVLLGGISKEIDMAFLEDKDKSKLQAVENITNGIWEDYNLFKDSQYFGDSSLIYQLIAVININNRGEIQLFLENLLDQNHSVAVEDALEPIVSYCEVFLGIEQTIDIEDFVLDPFSSKSTYGAWVKLLVLSWLDDPSYEKKLSLVLESIKDLPLSSFYTKEFNDLANDRGIVKSIKPVERWESVLTGLTTLLNKNRDTSSTDRDQRLAWRLSRSNRVVDFTPVIQKKSKNGKWTQGRKVEFYDLPHKYDTFNHTESDKKMITVGSSIYSYRDDYYYESDYNSYVELAKLAIGHKHLYDEKTKAEITLKEIPVMLESKKSKGFVELSVSPSGISDNLMTVKKRNNEWSVTFLTQEQLSIINIIGGKLRVPSDQVLESSIPVKGEVKTLGEDLERIPGETIPQVFITPFSSGLEFKIRAVPSNDNQLFIPGVGKSEYIGANEDSSVVVVRDFVSENSITTNLIESIPQFNIQYNQEHIWEFPDNLEALDVLEQLNEHNLKPVLNWPQGEKIELLKTVTSSSLFNSVSHSNEWFEVSGETLIDSNRVLTLKQLMALSEATSSRFIKLDTGEYLALTRSLKQEIDTLNTYSQKGKGEVVKLHPLALFAMQDSQLGRGFTESRKWIEQFKTNHEKHFDIPKSIKAELRDYQEDGYRWIMRLAESGAGALLADDMGLGKTLQAIVVLTVKKREEPAIIVVPASLIYNWDSEIRKFSPSLNPHILGTTDREELIGSLKGGDVLIVSYGIVQRNRRTYREKR